MRKILISGISGQDGSYLAELLLSKGCDVYGIQRRTSTITTERIDHIFEADNKKTFYADLADTNSLINVLLKVKPDEIYNLGSQSHVRISFEIPEYTAQVTGVGALRWLEALRSLGMTNVKYYQASSSEMFGISPPPQNENTPMLPQSPYGCAKLYAYHITKVYRVGYGMFACNGILFNHESERRGMNFVTQKIVYSAVNIKMDKQDKVKLGNLDAKRDWGFAKEYVDGMWRMLQADKPNTYVLATNRTETVRDFVTLAFQAIGCDLAWRGTGEAEQGFDAESGRVLVQVNPKFYRPAEVDLLIGDPAKAQTDLGWSAKTTLEELAQMMVAADLRRNAAGFSF